MSTPTLMIAKLRVRQHLSCHYSVRLTLKRKLLLEADGLSSVSAALGEGGRALLCWDIQGIEVAYNDVVCGTYEPRDIFREAGLVAEDAVRVYERLAGLR